MVKKVLQSRNSYDILISDNELITNNVINKGGRIRWV